MYTFLCVFNDHTDLYRHARALIRLHGNVLDVSHVSIKFTCWCASLEINSKLAHLCPTSMHA